MNKYFSILLLGVFTLCMSWGVQAQEERSIDRAEWNKIRESVRYGTKKNEGGKGEKWTYSDQEWQRVNRDNEGSGNTEQRRVKRSKNYNRNNDDSSSDSSSQGPILNSNWANLLYIILIISILGLIAYFIIKKYTANPQNTSAISEEQLSQSPQEIPITELQRMLQIALSEENYKEAVRIYFIFIIKELTERKWIQWKKDKTNLAYLREMRKKPHYELFKSTVNIFDIVWYGNYVLDQEGFKKLEPIFIELHQKLDIK